MKSDMVNGRTGSGGYIANEVGRNLYVWTEQRSKGRPSHSKCVISAHGAAALICNEGQRSKLPNTQVVFYGPHGSMLQNPGLYEIVTGLQRSYESCNAKALSQDYELAKSQDAHQSASGKAESKRGTGESYQFIGEQMHRMGEHTWSQLGYTAQGLAFYEQLAAIKDNYGRPIDMDIVTVRSRKMFADITLFEVINQLWSNGYKYQEFHCAFCRGVGDKPPSHNPANN